MCKDTSPSIEEQYLIHNYRNGRAAGKLSFQRSSNEVHVTLRSIHGSAKLYRLSFFTKDKLTVTTKSAELSREDKSFIKKEKITVAQQGLHSRELSPDILIGQDLLNTIIDHEAPTSRLPSGLLLTPTIFGHTISGTSGRITKSSKRNFALCSSLIITSLSSSSEVDSKTDIRRTPEVEPRRIKGDHDTAKHSTAKSLGRCRKDGIAKKVKEDDNSPATLNLPRRFVWAPSKTAVRAMDTSKDGPDYQTHHEPSSQRSVERTLSETKKITKKLWPFRRKEYYTKLRNRHKRAKKISRTPSESFNSNADLSTASKTEAKPRARGTVQPKDPATQTSSFTYIKDVQILPIQRHRGGRISR